MFRLLAPFVPLLAGFALAGASAFTAVFSHKWGERGGQIISSVLRNLLGIPLYFLGLVLAWQASLPALFDSTLVIRSLAWGLIVAGSIPIIVGHVQLGWRTHMPSLRDALMTDGLYARVRHPIYAGAVPVFVGLALLHPTMSFIAACVLSIAFFVIQARLEEIDLIARIPAYRQYMREVPAFFPLLGTGRAPEEQPWLADWYWLCPPIAIGLAAWVFAWWGFDWWTALLAALFLICPVLMIWGILYAGRKP